MTARTCCRGTSWKFFGTSWKLFGTAWRDVKVLKIHFHCMHRKWGAGVHASLLFFHSFHYLSIFHFLHSTSFRIFSSIIVPNSLRTHWSANFAFLFSIITSSTLQEVSDNYLQLFHSIRFSFGFLGIAYRNDVNKCANTWCTNVIKCKTSWF